MNLMDDDNVPLLLQNLIIWSCEKDDAPGCGGVFWAHTGHSISMCSYNTAS